MQPPQPALRKPLTHRATTEPHEEQLRQRDDTVPAPGQVQRGPIGNHNVTLGARGCGHVTKRSWDNRYVTRRASPGPERHEVVGASSTPSRTSRRAPAPFADSAQSRAPIGANYAATRGGRRRETTFDTPLPAMETP